MFRKKLPFPESGYKNQKKSDTVSYYPNCNEMLAAPTGVGWKDGLEIVHSCRPAEVAAERASGLVRVAHEAVVLRVDGVSHIVDEDSVGVRLVRDDDRLECASLQSVSSQRVRQVAKTFNK